MGGLGGASAAGAGNGAVIGNQAVGTGTGIANAGPGKQNQSPHSLLRQTIMPFKIMQVVSALVSELELVSQLLWEISRSGMAKVTLT